MIKFKSLINTIPLPIKLFLGKALLFFFVWKFIYVIFLYDSKFIDYPLTTHVGEASTKSLNSLSSMNGFISKRRITSSIYEGELKKREASQIYHNNKLVLNIADSCNGLELMILYIGFIVCMPSGFWRKVLYIILGVIIIDVINISRCMGLIYLREYFHAYFDFAHHYLFKATVYTATFLMWMVYARKIHLKNETIQIR
ncbi:MAG: archaeosortase/exosortase family protein [Algibacter sp.]|uniref:archaeosortase/exosortase family protein n=1 Tax=Algibacter sp. TaxID=1872428 RepID=UPI002626ACE3|nr:archaeosortase/exosortase family protein [Algibacter sp.]MDG1728678.1 archaeosortase/exosortase family protein [Algibacter sp.]MDG2178475.1 archaeosortase/exosortase family protein [Algibacter sp.]